jgi:scyllo-inositol 2-dehydrogenase (NADP+)
MTENRELQAAVIGFGLGGRIFHAPFISAVPGLRLATILERSGHYAAEAYPEAHIARSLDEVLGDPAIDLVSISTPNETHTAIARAALDAGKHVVVDKPFAGTSGEALALMQLARSRGLVLAPFHNRRWDGDFLTVKKLFTSGALGRVATIESHFDRFRPLPREGTWKESANPANGMLFDLGPHLVDQAIGLCGTPKTIQASVRRDRDQTKIEDAFDITLGFETGTTADTHALLYHCRTTMLAADAAPRFHVHGTLGSYRKGGVDPQEPALVAGQRPPMQSAAGDDWLYEPEAMWGTLTIAPNPADPANLTHTRIETERCDYRGFYANVRDAILGREPLVVTPEEGYRVVRLLELARESSSKGTTLTVEFEV